MFMTASCIYLIRIIKKSSDVCWAGYFGMKFWTESSIWRMFNWVGVNWCSLAGMWTSDQGTHDNFQKESNHWAKVDVKKMFHSLGGKKSLHFLLPFCYCGWKLKIRWLHSARSFHFTLSKFFFNQTVQLFISSVLPGGLKLVSGDVELVFGCNSILIWRFFDVRTIIRPSV